MIETKIEYVFMVVTLKFIFHVYLFLLLEKEYPLVSIISKIHFLIHSIINIFSL